MKLTELIKLADAANDVTSFDNEPDWYSATKLFDMGIGYEEDCKFIEACHPATVKLMAELLVMAREALAKYASDRFMGEVVAQEALTALDEFDKEK